MDSQARPSLSGAAEAQVVTVIKNKTNQLKPKSKAQPSDPSRMIIHDPRDPRAQNRWPCFNQHKAAETWRSNAHGSWQHCLVCDLKLAYIPKKGSPSNSTMAVNHAMVDQMLMELEPLMQGKMPTQAICKAMMDKITAETQLLTLIDAAIQELPVHVQGPKPKFKSKAKSGYPETTSSPDSQASWEVMPDVEELLSEEEKNNLANLLRDRRAMQQASMMDASENVAEQ